MEGFAGSKRVCGDKCSNANYGDKGDSAQILGDRLQVISSRSSTAKLSRSIHSSVTTVGNRFAVLEDECDQGRDDTVFLAGDQCKGVDCC